MSNTQRRPCIPFCLLGSMYVQRNLTFFKNARDAPGCSGMLRDAPAPNQNEILVAGCSGMLRDAPGCFRSENNSGVGMLRDASVGLNFKNINFITFAVLLLLLLRQLPFLYQNEAYICDCFFFWQCETFFRSCDKGNHLVLWRRLSVWLVAFLASLPHPTRCSILQIPI